MDKELTARLKYARERAEMSQKELASILGMTPSNWNKIETGKINLTFELAESISNALCVELSYLAGKVPYTHAVTDPTYHHGRTSTERQAELDALIDNVKESEAIQSLIKRVGDWPSPLIKLFMATIDSFEAGLEAASLFTK